MAFLLSINFYIEILVLAPGCRPRQPEAGPGLFTFLISFCPNMYNWILATSNGALLRRAVEIQLCFLS
jgi:hypothetical protein